MQKNANKIFLVDDHILLRDGLASMINKFDGCTVIGTAADGREMIKSFSDGSKPNLVILDLNMPVMNGYDTAEWLKKNHPTIRILILTMYASDFALVRLLQMGVKGFLKKDIHPADLKTAIEHVMNNGYYYCNTSTGQLASFVQLNQYGEPKMHKSMLTEMEINFLKLAATDLTYKEVASKLKLSARTIDAIRDTLFDKLDIKSRVGLAIYAVKNGIVEF